MEKGHFRPTWGSKTSEPIHLKFSSLITSTVRLDTQNMVAAENAGWGGHMGEVVPSRAFFSFFGYFNAFTPYTGISAECTQNVFR